MPPFLGLAFRPTFLSEVLQCLNAQVPFGRPNRQASHPRKRGGLNHNKSLWEIAGPGSWCTRSTEIRSGSDSAPVPAARANGGTTGSAGRRPNRSTRTGDPTCPSGGLQRIRMTVNVDFAPQGCDLETLVAMACRRWVIEHAFKAAKQDTGLDTSGDMQHRWPVPVRNAGTAGLGATGRSTGGGADTPPNLCQVELRQQVPVLVWSRPP